MNSYSQAEGRFDWQHYVRDHGGVAASNGRTDEYILECPKCSKDKLAVNVVKQAWRCFTCNTGGRSATSLVAQIEGLGWHSAMVSVLEGHQSVIGPIERITNLLIPEDNRPDNWIPAAREWPGSVVPVGFNNQAGVAGVNYCARRNITPNVARCLNLQVCQDGLFNNRLMFPVYDSNRRLVFYQGRAMWDPKQGYRYIKTLSAKTDPEGTLAGSGDVLLNLTYVANQRFERIAIVEGPIDCAHAFPDAVCTFGKHISNRQIELLMRAGIKALDLCYDSDAQQDMLKIAPALADIFKVRLVMLPIGTDPGDLTKQQIDYHRSRAIECGSGSRLATINCSLN